MPLERVARHVRFVRGEAVLLDSDLAELYGVATKELNKAVKRNVERFPADFLFQLTAEEAEALRFQSGTSKSRGGRRYLPYAFTEHGVAMLSSVLRSERAVQVNIAIMRAFVQMRKMIASNAELARKIDALESKYDEQFRVVFTAIKALFDEDEQRRKTRTPIGYLTEASGRSKPPKRTKTRRPKR